MQNIRNNIHCVIYVLAIVELIRVSFRVNTRVKERLVEPFGVICDKMMLKEPEHIVKALEVIGEFSTTWKSNNITVEGRGHMATENNCALLNSREIYLIEITFTKHFVSESC